jgi:hypothetical protein
VKKSLTPEQAEKLNAWKSQRQAFMQKTAVEHFVAQVDAKLLLSGEQREKLMSWVNNHHGPALAKRLTPQRQAFNRVFIGGGIQVRNNGKPKVDSEIAEILSETQTATWLTRFQGQLKTPNAGVPPFIQIQANMLEVEIDN